ncbi:MAG: hypothetical protein ACOYNB_05500 [Aquabacterium sp.]|uniref:hypothetical protein n=1 Tax=Aquabacterium sp. TaxID=1872578 RepID=UPI003BBEE6D6
MPRGLSDQVQGGVTARYRYASEAAERYLEVELTNAAAQGVGHYALFVGDRLGANSGVLYRVAAIVQIERGQFRGGVGLGFHAFEPNGNYATEWAPPEGVGDVYFVPRQTLVAEHVSGTVMPRLGHAPASVAPRLTVMNILPGQTVVLRIFKMAVARATLTGVGVGALPFVPKSLLSGRSVKLQVPLWFAQPAGKGWQATMSIVNDQGRVLLTDSHPLPDGVAATSGQIWDVWLMRVPTNQGLDHGHAVRVLYRLSRNGASVKLAPLQSSVSVELAGAGVGAAVIGRLAWGKADEMLIGAGFHHYPNSSQGRSAERLGAVKLKYQFARSYASDHAVLPWWTVSSERPDYAWARLDRWANAFADAGQRRLLMVFSGMPTSASRHPENRNNPFGAPGLSEPANNWEVYGKAVRDSVSRYKDRLVAVECWNEPDVIGFFAGSQRDLADQCKAVYQSVKAADASIPVICPQASSPEGMGFVLAARTSQGESITDFCDMVGAHIYKGTGRDLTGRAASADSLDDELALIRARLAAYKVNKPIAVTEFGVDRCVNQPAAGVTNLDQMSDAKKADVIYQSVATLAMADVRLLGLYSYDLADNANGCAKGGYLWLTNEQIDQMNGVVLKRLNEAVQDFGRSIDLRVRTR